LFTEDPKANEKKEPVKEVIKLESGNLPKEKNKKEGSVFKFDSSEEVKLILDSEEDEADPDSNHHMK